MPRKKSVELSEMQTFYLKSNREKPVEELANTTGLDVVAVQNFYTELDAVPKKPKPKSVYSAGKGTGSRNGVRILTPAESENADIDLEKYRGSGKISKRFKPDIMILDKDR